MKRSSLWPALVAGHFCVTSFFAVNARAEHIDSVTVTALLNKPEDQSPVPVTVISNEELQRRAAGTLGATLDSSPGVSSASFGPGVGQPVIRGQNGPRVMTLINGTASADASGVSADHAVTVEPMLAESIEVLRGPSTLLFGGGAIGGIVNIVDNRIPQKLPDSTNGAIELRHDNVDDGDTSVVMLNGGAGQFAYHVDGVYREWSDIDIPALAFNREFMDTEFSSNHYTANTDGRNHTLTGGVSWIGDDSYIGFSISDMNNNYGIPLDEEAEGDPINGVHIDMEQKRYDIAAEKRELSDVIDALRWHLTYSDYEHQEIENSGAIGTTFTNETWESRLELAHGPVSGWSGAIGLQLKRGDFAAVGEESFIPESIANAGGLFVLESYQIDSLTYQLGARYDRDSIDPDSAENNNAVSEKKFDNVSASASVLWAIDGIWDAGLAVSRSQRAPAVEELFSNVESASGDLVVHEASHTIEIGDPDLDRETSHNIDLTLHYKGERAHGYVTVFHNEFRDFIALADTGGEQDDTPIMAYTQQDARFNGVEFELNLPLTAHRSGNWSVDVYGDHTRGRFIGDSGHSSADKNAPRLPPLRVGTRLNFDRGAFSAYAGVLHAAQQEDPAEYETETDSYNRVDAGASYQLRADENFGALLFVRATNLTDQTIRNSVSLLKDIAPEPGRSLETGVRFTF